MAILLCTLLVIAAFVVVAHGSDKCCTPDQWQATMGEIGSTVINGKHELTQGNVLVSYDYLNQKLAVMELLNINGEELNIKIIIDYKKGEMVHVQGSNCRKMVINEKMFRQCIPDSAINLGPTYYGTGANKLQAMQYLIRTDNIQGYITVADGCVPVTQARFSGPKEDPSLITTGFLNFIAEIKDEAVFTPPDICDKEFLQKDPALSKNILNKRKLSRFIGF